MPGFADILPTVDGSVRDGLHAVKDGNPDDVLDHSIVQVLNTARPTLPFEDRGILEFNVSSLSQAAQVLLTLHTFGTVGPFPFSLDIYAYAGDGVLSLSDFNAGSLFTSVVYTGQPPIAIDVTAAISTLNLPSSGFAGFNIRKPLADNIEMNGPFAAFGSNEYPLAATLSEIPAPSTVPEPSSILLFGTAVLALRGRSWVLRAHGLLSGKMR
ncbi:MAG: PEP-CTERM sorting domain-containing protein [Candidatus Solibacter sp.]|nr:PEP-CTERM sorting domain-containing protein [Candidatus Solibacter sp.]